jgi:hypothetical protein
MSAPVAVGVDGSVEALAAAEFAADLAFQRGRPLRVVHTFGVPMSEGPTRSLLVRERAARAVLGSANAVTTVLCGLTNGQPASACASPAAAAFPEVARAQA